MQEDYKPKGPAESAIVRAAAEQYWVDAMAAYGDSSKLRDKSRFLSSLRAITDSIVGMERARTMIRSEAVTATQLAKDDSLQNLQSSLSQSAISSDMRIASASSLAKLRDLRIKLRSATGDRGAIDSSSSRVTEIGYSATVLPIHGNSKRDPLTRTAQEAVPSSFIPHGRVIDETQSSIDDDIDDDDIDDDVEADEETVPAPAQHPSQGSLPIVPQPIDLKSDECEEVLEDFARKSGGAIESEVAHAFDRAQRDYHFSRLLSWEAALREREDRLLFHSSNTLSNRSRRSSTPIEAEKAPGSADSPLSPHIHIHNHLPSPSPIPSASVALQDSKPTVVLGESSRAYDRRIVPSQITEGTTDGKPVVMRPSSTSLGQQSCKDNALHSSIDLSGLSLERLRELTGHY